MKSLDELNRTSFTYMEFSLPSFKSCWGEGCTCLYAWIYLCVRMCLSAYMVCAYVCKYICVCSVHGYLPVCTSAYVCMHKCVYSTRMWACRCMQGVTQIIALTFQDPSGHPKPPEAPNSTFALILPALETMKRSN